MKINLLFIILVLTVPIGYTQVLDKNLSTQGVNWLLLPQPKYSIGLQHEYNSFAINNNHTDHASTNNNYFHTFNISGRIRPHKRVQIIINFPIQYHVQKTESGTRELAGPGDISVITQYRLLRTRDSSVGMMKHSLIAGVGVKMPTGRYNMYDETGFYDRHMQPGTGSWDVLINTQYVVKWNSWGLNTTVNAKISTQGADNYLYGHTVNTGLNAFYWGKGEKLSVLASGGLHYSYQSKDVFMRQYQPVSGGHLLSAQVNAGFYIKKWVVGIDVKLPLYAYMGGGDIKQGPQVTTQIAALF